MGINVDMIEAHDMAEGLIRAVYYSLVHLPHKCFSQCLQYVRDNAKRSLRHHLPNQDLSLAQKWTRKYQVIIIINNNPSAMYIPDSILKYLPEVYFAIFTTGYLFCFTEEETGD